MNIYSVKYWYLCMQEYCQYSGGKQKEQDCRKDKCHHTEHLGWGTYQSRLTERWRSATLRFSRLRVSLALRRRARRDRLPFPLPVLSSRLKPRAERERVLVENRNQKLLDFHWETIKGNICYCINLNMKYLTALFVAVDYVCVQTEGVMWVI